MDRANKHREYLVKYYNRITKSEAVDISQIPADVLAFISTHEYKHLVTPFIADEIRKKKHKHRHIAKIFGLRSASYVRKIGERMGVLSRRY